MLKVGGIWVSPVEIEARLIAHEAVLEAAVVGRADDDGLIKPEAWIVLAEGQAASDGLSEALVAHCKAGLARYKYPALGPLRRRLAQDRDRQDPALQAARVAASDPFPDVRSRALRGAPNSSWPGLSRPSTACLCGQYKERGCPEQVRA